MLDLATAEGTPIVEIQQDDQPLSPQNAGKDVFFDEDGRSFIRLERPRMNQLVQNETYEWHELKLIFRKTGAALYTFTFNTCVVPKNEALNVDTFQVK